MFSIYNLDEAISWLKDQQQGSDAQKIADAQHLVSLILASNLDAVAAAVAKSYPSPYLADKTHDPLLFLNTIRNYVEYMIKDIPRVKLASTLNVSLSVASKFANHRGNWFLSSIERLLEGADVYYKDDPRPRMPVDEFIRQIRNSVLRSIEGIEVRDLADRMGIRDSRMAYLLSDEADWTMDIIRRMLVAANYKEEQDETRKAA